MASVLENLKMVTFFLDQQEYAIDVMSVREIIGMTDITKTANSPYHVEGIINLRGTIVPILSLRKRLNMPDTANDVLTCIAVMDIAGALTGFVIDEVSDVMSIKRSDIQPPLDTASQPWIEGVLTLDQRLIVVLNLSQLV